MDESRRQEVSDELKQFQSSIWEEHDGEIPQELLHYTTPSGFRGIVKSRELWAPDICRMSDTSEGLHALELLRQVVTRKSVPHWFEELIWRSPTLFGMGSHWSGYIACFSSGGEQFSQWEAYADRCTGCAIGFDRDKLLGAAEDGELFAVIRMLYDPNLQRDRLTSTIDHAIYLWRGSGLARRDEYEFWLQVMFVLLVCSVRLKNPCFATENEVRLIIMEADSNDALGANREADSPRHLSVPIDPALLTRVIVGPKAGPDLTPDEARGLLDGHGFNTVKVERSIVPIR